MIQKHQEARRTMLDVRTQKAVCVSVADSFNTEWVNYYALLQTINLWEFALQWVKMHWKEDSYDKE